MGKVTYDADMREKAKAGGLYLVTLDIYGKFAKRSSATGQTFLFTDEEADKVWEFFRWMHSRRKPPAKGS